MLTQSYRTDGDRGVRPCGLDQALVGPTREGEAHWVEVSAEPLDEVAAWLAAQGVPAPVIEQLTSPPRFTQVLGREQGIVCVTRVLREGDSRRTDHLATYCTSRLLISIDADCVATSLEPLAASAAGLLCALLDVESTRVLRAVRGLKTRVLDFDDRADRDPDSVQLDELQELKDELLRVLAIAEEQEECFQTLPKAMARSLPGAALEDAIELLRASAGSAARMAERLEKRVANVRQRHDARQQERVNHRLAILTVVSAVFLPLTLMAGIWGMNFEAMPELQLPYAYPIALLLMASVAALLVWALKRRGWFD